MTSTRDTTKLIEQAVHDSVTEQKLTQLGFGLLEGDLYTQPLVDYLAADEQPHFIFSRGMADSQLTIEGPNAPPPPRENGSNKTIHLITDRRWLVVTGNKNGDQTLSVPLGDITGLAVETEPWTNTVSFTTDRFCLEAQINLDEKEDLDTLHRWLVVNAGVDGTGLKPIEGTETPRDVTESEGVTSLVETAAHDSVTEPRLTERKTGLLTRDLYTKPLIDYLTDDEQPHFILDTHGSNVSLEGAYAPRVPEHNGAGTVKHLITDRRWLVVAANKNGDQTLGVPLGDISGIDVDPGRLSHTVSFTTERFRLDAPIANAHNKKDLRFVQQFLLANTDADGTGLKEIERSLAVHMDAEPQGSWVTESHITEMGKTLEAGEAVHYMFRGGSLDIEGAGPSDKASFSGVFTAATDERIAINVSQFLGDDERYIPYSAIVSCDLDTGMMSRYVTINTRGPTYKIHVSQPSDGELREALQFIREKAKTASDSVDEKSRSDRDPTEQLKNLSELYEKDVLTDEEFEKKKRQLLDKI